MNPSADSDESRNEPAPDERGALMSALADGDAAALQRGCALWRDDAQARATWHAYHLIGDVLRSEDLANRPSRDAAFLAALRTRLADEPVVLAPQPAAAAAARRRPVWQPWLMPAAVAAGFMAVAGVLVVTRIAGPVADGPVLAASPAPNTALTLAGNAAPVAQPLVIEGRLIRDARLDSYLRAHREALGGAPYALPGGVPRNVETLAPMAPAAQPAAR